MKGSETIEDFIDPLGFDPEGQAQRNKDCGGGQEKNLPKKGTEKPGRKIPDIGTIQIICDRYKRIRPSGIG